MSLQIGQRNMVVERVKLYGTDRPLAQERPLWGPEIGGNKVFGVRSSLSNHNWIFEQCCLEMNQRK